MEIGISDTPWFCPGCGSTLFEDECESARRMLRRGYAYIELKCEECGGRLAADISESTAGSVALTSLKTPAQQAEAVGLPSLQVVADLTGVSRQTLQNWHKNKPRLFAVVLAGCVAEMKEGS